MKATSFSSSISANLGNSGEAMVEILSRDRMEDDEKFCKALPIHLCVQSMHTREYGGYGIEYGGYRV